MKKFTAILMVFAMLFSFAACKDNSKDEGEGMTNPYVTGVNGEAVTNEQGESVTIVSGESTTQVSSDAEDTTAATEMTVPSEDPSTWTKEQIVEFYKNAAISSKTKVKSIEYKNLEEMVVNDGDGALGTFVELATPFLVKALEDSQAEFDGITGGYENLVPEDVQSAKAYKSGEGIVVEMTMKEQTDGIHGDRYSGTVGHAISVVGDISSVEEALAKWFEIDFENGKVSLRYTKPTLKVKINKDGVVEKGTWSYTIKINVSNLKIAAVRLPIEVMVDKAHGTVDYVITVGGGF